MLKEGLKHRKGGRPGEPGDVELGKRSGKPDNAGLRGTLRESLQRRIGMTFREGLTRRMGRHSGKPDGAGCLEQRHVAYSERSVKVPRQDGLRIIDGWTGS